MCRFATREAGVGPSSGRAHPAQESGRSRQMGRKAVAQRVILPYPAAVPALAAAAGHYCGCHLSHAAGRGHGMRGFPAVIGNTQMPYLNRLVDQYGLATDWHHHNPFMYFDSIRNSPTQCRRAVSFTELALDLRDNTAPDFIWCHPTSSTTCTTGFTRREMPSCDGSSHRPGLAVVPGTAAWLFSPSQGGDDRARGHDRDLAAHRPRRTADRHRESLRNVAGHRGDLRGAAAWRAASASANDLRSLFG